MEKIFFDTSILVYEGVTIVNPFENALPQQVSRDIS